MLTESPLVCDIRTSYTGYKNDNYVAVPYTTDQVYDQVVDALSVPNFIAWLKKHPGYHCLPGCVTACVIARYLNDTFGVRFSVTGYTARACVEPIDASMPMTGVLVPLPPIFQKIVLKFDSLAPKVQTKTDKWGHGRGRIRNWQLISLVRRLAREGQPGTPVVSNGW